MKHRRMAAVAVLLVMVIALTGCNYVSRPVGAGNNASDTSNTLAQLLQQPVKNIVEVTNIKEVTKPAQDSEQKPDDGNNEPAPDNETKVTSPFGTTTDVFDKIQEILGKVKDEMVTAKSATGVSDELMSGRTVYVYTPYDISGNDAVMMKAVANKLNMTVVVNNLNLSGVQYSVAMKKIVKSGVKADLMFVDQNIWGDIQYYTQAINSFVNFDLGDSLNTFRSSMSQNFHISDAYFKSERANENFYVASGIGAPYLLAYNKDNLVTTGKLAEQLDGGITYKEVALADPAKMFSDKTWGLKAMQQMLINSTVDKCVGLATVQGENSNVDWWFGCDNVPGFMLDIYSRAAQISAEDDYVSVGGMSRYTLDTIQELYWTSTGANKQKTANFISEFEKEKAITKLFNTYSGGDAITKYAMLGINAEDLPTMFAQAGGANWDFVGYPYGTMTENKIRSTEPVDDVYYESNETDPVYMATAGWASGFAVLDSCTNPGIALRFAEDYTVAWRDQFEGAFSKLLSKDQAARYQAMKDNMGVTFYRSMMSHAVEGSAAYEGADAKASSSSSSSTVMTAAAEFSANPDLYTHLMYNKETSIGAYNPAAYPKWSNFFTTAKADGMAGSYQLARVMFNY